MGESDLTCPSRRSFLAGAIAAAVVPARAAAGPVNDAQAIVDRFTAAGTMSGRFMQFGPDGSQTEGKFMIERPGRARFDYSPPSHLKMIADGRTVAVWNGKLKTWDLYPLSKTPLKMLLGERVPLADRRVRSINGEDGLVSIRLADPDLFGNAFVDVIFDRNTGDLRQWTVTDSAGRETAVVVFDVMKGVKFPPSAFRIPYSEIRTLK